MTVDMADLTETLQREIASPLDTSFNDVSDDFWLDSLRDSFWEAKLFGFFDNYSESEGLLVPISGSSDMPREEQQLIVLFAGARVLRNELRRMNTMFRAKAGPVEFETQNSANLLRELLLEVRRKIDFLISSISDLGSVNDYYIDSITARTDAFYNNDTTFVANRGAGLPYNNSWWGQ